LDIEVFKDIDKNLLLPLNEYLGINDIFEVPFIHFNLGTILKVNVNEDAS
jgi:hypothetical protein